MKLTRLLLLSTVLLCNASIAANVYRCPTGNKTVEYTENYQANCEDVSLEQNNTYHSTPVDQSSSHDLPYPNPAPNPTSLHSDQSQRVEEARRALEEGKKVRYGNERNYAKYLERIQQLEDDLKKAEGKN